MSERGMNKHQRGMVDGCFEEGHYQRGIASLNQLRMQNLRPSPAHVRQLIYISLYPPPPPKAIADDKGKRKEVPIVSGSPSKQIQQARRLQKQALFPPPEATEAAKELLHQFSIDSISPESLLCAVPCYPLTKSELENAPRLIKTDVFPGDVEAVEDMDSYVAKEAARLKECKDFWNMLRTGVVTRQDTALARIEDPFLDADSGLDMDEADSSSTIVGKYSWHLLEWFVLLFEKDQALASTTGNSDEGGYSILLLSQIKPASISGEPRAHTDSIVDVVFLCYNQPEQWRRNLGKRLLALLVSLTRCNDFSPLQLFKTISARLHASSGDMVISFLGDLPVTPLGFTVKLAVCDRFLTHSLQGPVSTNSDGLVRARPLARRARPVSTHTNADSQSPSRSQSGLVSNQDGQSKWGLPSAQRILQLLELCTSLQSGTSGRMTNLSVVLFHLLVAFGTLRAEEDKHAEHAWVEAILTGELERKIQDVYGADEQPESDSKVMRPLRLLLLSKCTSWKQLFV